MKELYLSPFPQIEAAQCREVPLTWEKEREINSGHRFKSGIPG
jgi:hypothetical protein